MARLKKSSAKAFDDHIYTLIPAKDFHLLLETFNKYLTTSQPRPHTDFPPHVEAWCRFTFAIIAFGGLAGRNCFIEILGMRLSDLLPVNNGYITVPRKGGHLPVYVDDLVAICALSLCIHLSREYSPAKYQLGSYPNDGFILPGRSSPCIPLKEEEKMDWRSKFERWLDGLSHLAGVDAKVTIYRLAMLTRGELVQRYSPPVVATITAQHLYHPARPEQKNDFDDYKKPLDLAVALDINIPDSSNRLRKVRWAKDRNANVKSEDKKKPISVPVSFAKLRRLIIQYSRSEKDQARRVKKQVIKELNSFLVCLELSISKNQSETWRDFLGRKIDSGFTQMEIDCCNTVMIGWWLKGLMRRAPPNTIECRLNDISKLIQSLDGELLVLLNGERISHILHGSLIAPSSKVRLADSIRNFYEWAEREYGFSIPDVPWWAFGKEFKLHYQSILSQNDLQRLITELRRDEVTRNANIAAVLIGYYFGLRASELCRLRIGDLQVQGIPTVFVWNSKRGYSRHVEGVEIPSTVISFLQEHNESRIIEQNVGQKSLLLVDKKDRPIKRNRLGRMLGNAMEKLGIEIEVGEKRSIVHSLRRSCANRWLSLGVPIIEISRRLGHRSADTTIREYLHTLHFLQAEQLAAAHMQQRMLEFSSSGVATLIGLTQRRVRQMISSEKFGFEGNLNRLGNFRFSIEDVKSILYIYFSKYRSERESIYSGLESN